MTDINKIDDYIYFVAEYGNFCPRGILINMSKTTPNLLECSHNLFNSSIKISDKYFEYTKNPLIKIKENMWRQADDMPETDEIVNCLITYSDSSPINRYFDNVKETDEPAGIPPLYVNGWYDYALLDAYRYFANKKIDDPYPTEYNGIKINIVKKIFVIEPELQ